MPEIAPDIAKSNPATIIHNQHSSPHFHGLNGLVVGPNAALTISDTTVYESE